MAWHVVLASLVEARSLRSQAEVISTIIIVSVALIIALGLVYYLGPFVAESQSRYRLYSLLSSYASALSIVPVSTINTTSNITSVLIIKNTGSLGFRAYLAIIPFYQRVPVPVNATSLVYNMTNNYSVIDPNDFTGWSLLNGANVSSFLINVYIISSYYKLSNFIENTNVLVYDLGILQPGSTRVLKIVLVDPIPVYSYSVTIFARVGDNYYEIGRFILYSGG